MNYSNFNNYQGGFERQSYKPYRNDNYNNFRPKKKSGCSYKSTTKSGKPCLIGWKVSKRDGGIISFIAAPYKNTRTTTSQQGIVWENWICSLRMPNGTTQPIPCLINMENKKMYIKKMNLIANPKANNGGYFGKHISKNYR